MAHPRDRELAATRSWPADLGVPVWLVGKNKGVITAGTSVWESEERRRVPVPGSLGELYGPLEGIASLPARLFWLGPDPRRVEWDLSDRVRRRDLYEIVLVKGTLDDICLLVNGPELVRLWDDMYLPPWVREAWHRLVEASDVAA
jgi:hypothetical protein